MYIEKMKVLNIPVGSKALLTTVEWFYGPDAKQYRAVFGTIKSVKTAEQTLGVRPNGRSTNWYVEIGDVTIAGCQVNYAVRCDECFMGPVDEWTTHDGELKTYSRPCLILDADNCRPPPKSEA